MAYLFSSQIQGTEEVDRGRKMNTPSELRKAVIVAAYGRYPEELTYSLNRAEILIHNYRND